MENDSTYVTRCFIRDAQCPRDLNGKFCRAWNGKEGECFFISFLKDLSKPKMTVKHPESAPPPEVKS